MIWLIIKGVTTKINNTISNLPVVTTNNRKNRIKYDAFEFLKKVISSLINEELWNKSPKRENLFKMKKISWFERVVVMTNHFF